MDTTSIPPAIARQWAQVSAPIIVRSSRKGDKLTVRLPYQPDNSRWVHSLASGQRKADIHYIKSERTWKAPVSWLDRLVDGALDRYGEVYIVQPYRELEVCAPACRNAVGHECHCSCMGANHGVGGGDGWFDVSDTLSFRWGSEMAAIRLLKRRLGAETPPRVSAALTRTRRTVHFPDLSDWDDL